MANFGVAIQTNQIPVQGLTPQASATAPDNPVAGELWTDTSVSPPVVKYFNGTTWVRTNGADIPDSTITDAKISASAAIALSKLATNPLARANHTGTQAASTISDLATVVKAYRLDEFAGPTSAIDMGGQKIVNLGDGTQADDAVTKQQVESWIEARVSGQDWKASVVAATTENVTLSGTQTVDGVALTAGDRVLVRAQTDPAENGIYEVDSGSWTRTTDANDGVKVTTGMTVPVESGDTLGGTIWLLTSPNPIDLDTTELVFVQIGAAGATYSAGAGLVLNGNEFALSVPVTIARGGTNATTAPAARANLGAPGIFTASMPALAVGQWEEIEHGLGNEDISKPSVRIAATGEFIELAYRVVDADTIEVRSDLDWEAGDLVITVIG